MAYYRGLETKTNTPIGQLVINNFGENKINLDHNLAKLFGIGQNLPLKTIIKRIVNKFKCKLKTFLFKRVYELS